MSLAATYIDDLNAAFPSNLDQDHNRQTQHGLLEAVMSMTSGPNSIISQDLQSKALKSQGLEIDIPIRRKGQVTIKNVRSCDVQCGQSATDTMRVVWKTMVVDLCMVPSQYPKNEMGYLADLNQKIKERVEAMKSEIENDLDSDLDTAKNQVYNSGIVSDKYTPVANALQVAYEDREFFFNDIDPINFEDDFYSTEVSVIASPSLMADVRKYTNQGDANKVDWQFNNKSFTFSNRVTNDTGVSSTMYFMPKNAIGILSRVDVEAEREAKAQDGTEWSKETLPGFPFPVGIKYSSKCSDQSTLEAQGLGHLTAVEIQHWQISLDYARLVQYNPDITTESGSIRKVEFLPKP